MAWGLPGLFVIALIDSAGIPLPQGVDALLLILAAKNSGRAHYYALSAFAGSVAGCLFLFGLARQGGRAFLDRAFPPEKTQRVRGWCARYGLAGTFITVLVPVIPLPTKAFIISSGALGTPTGPFVLAVIVARAARYAGEAWLGAQMGDQAWPWLRAHGRELAIAALGLFLLLFVLLKVSDRHAKLRNAVQG